MQAPKNILSKAKVACFVFLFWLLFIFIIGPLSIIATLARLIADLINEMAVRSSNAVEKYTLATPSQRGAMRKVTYQLFGSSLVALLCFLILIYW